MTNIPLEVTRAIYEGKWLMVSYQNKKEETTYFWCAITDIDPSNKALTVDLFNATKSVDTLVHQKIFYNSILSATVIEGTYYPKPESLIQKIEGNYASFAFLEFPQIQESILDYYEKCYKEDGINYYREHELFKGIDIYRVQEGNYSLTNQECIELVQFIKEKEKLKKHQLYALALNELALSIEDKLYPIVYYNILFDVEKKCLMCSKEPRFNLKLHDEDDKLKFDLGNFLEMNPLTFMETYKSCKEEYITNLSSRLPSKMKIDEMPYFFEIQTQIKIHLEQEYDCIKNSYQENKLSRPLQAFFGLKQRKYPTQNIPIVLYNQSPNIEQLATIYHALNQDVSYVQGPPGTGKTATILHTIFAHFFHEKTVLITSNNNEALQNIYTKLESQLFGRTLLPVLRLGGDSYIEESLEQMAQLKECIEKVPSKKEEILNHFASLNQAIKQYEQQKEWEEELDALRTLSSKIEKSTMDSFQKEFLLLPFRANEERILSALEETKPIELPKIDADLLLKQIQYLRRKCYENFNRNQELQDILKLEGKERLQAFKRYCKEPTTFKNVLKSFPIIISTNLSCPKLGEAKPIFDLLIMDEASQSGSALSLLALARAKSCVLVGDQNQLRPVVTLDPKINSSLKRIYDISEAYDYSSSILSTMLLVDPLSKFTLLKKHYRCHPKIIGFSNQKYYDNVLEIMTKPTEGSLTLTSVTGVPDRAKNTSLTEAFAVLKEVMDHNGEDIAVITPFRSQAKLLQKCLIQNGFDKVKVGTIHTFQGDEKDTIMISTALTHQTSQGSYDWIKNNEQLLNVACTRAKKNLIILVDPKEVERLSGGKKDDFNDLLSYAKSNGTTKVDTKENMLFRFKVKNYKYFNTEAEKEFMDTLLHFKSTMNQTITIKEKVKVTDVLKITADEKNLFLYANQAHFDFVLYNGKGIPFLAIEVNGYEHYQNSKVIERDQKKKEIAEKHNLILLTIHNDYVRRYNYISKLIMDLFK